MSDKRVIVNDPVAFDRRTEVMRALGLGDVSVSHWSGGTGRGPYCLASLDVSIEDGSLSIITRMAAACLEIGGCLTVSSNRYVGFGHGPLSARVSLTHSMAGRVAREKSAKRIHVEAAKDTP